MRVIELEEVALMAVPLVFLEDEGQFAAVEGPEPFVPRDVLKFLSRPQIAYFTMVLVPRYLDGRYLLI